MQFESTIEQFSSLAELWHAKKQDHEGHEDREEHEAGPAGQSAEGQEGVSQGHESWNAIETMQLPERDETLGTMEIFNSIDTNGDRVITRQEWNEAATKAKVRTILCALQAHN